MANILDKLEATLLLDETQVYSRVDKTEIVTMLNTGQKRGQYYIRAKVGSGQDCNENEYLKTFGWKALAGTKELAVTIEDRSLILRMRKPQRKYVKRIDEDKAKELRCKLLKFRFDTLRKLKKIGGYEDVFEGWGDKGDKGDGFPRVLERLDPRYEELITPLLQLVPSDEANKKILGFALDYYNVKMNEDKSSLEAQIVEAIHTLYTQKEYDVKSLTGEGLISITKISLKINEGLSEKESIKNTTIGRILKTLGFKKTRTKSIRYIVYDEDLVRSHLEGYGLIKESNLNTSSLSTSGNPSPSSSPSPTTLTQFEVTVT
jgi:hypothetical protein